MHLEIRHNGQFLIVQFKRLCNLNFGNTEEFKTQILQQYQASQTVILNFEKLDYIDSAGLTVLIHIRKKVQETKGRLKIVNVGEKIKKLLQITRLHRVFEIYDSLELAINSAKSKSDQEIKTNPFAIHLQVKHGDSCIWAKIKQPDSLIKANTKQFREKLSEYLSKTNTLIINFDNIRNIDSAGIASLIHLKRLSRETKKKIFLVYNNRVLNRLFKLYSLDDLFAQFQTDQEAFNAVKPVKTMASRTTIKSPPVATPAPVMAGIGIEFCDILFLTSVDGRSKM